MGAFDMQKTQAQLNRRLLKAVKKRNILQTKSLLDEGADPNSEGSFFQAPSLLYQAAVDGSIDIVKLLLAAGAKVNFAHPNFGTALFAASQKGVADLVSVLLDAGADPNIACDRVQMNGLTALTEACARGHHGIAKMLVAAGANVNHRIEPTGHTPLVNAIIAKDVELVQFLLESGASLKTKFRKFRDCTPLHSAAISGNLRIVQLLMAHGADPNALDSKRNTPCAYTFNGKIMQALTSRGREAQIAISSSTPDAPVAAPRPSEEDLEALPSDSAVLRLTFSGVYWILANWKYRITLDGELLDEAGIAKPYYREVNVRLGSHVVEIKVPLRKAKKYTIACSRSGYYAVILEYSMTWGNFADSCKSKMIATGPQEHDVVPEPKISSSTSMPPPLPKESQEPQVQCPNCGRTFAFSQYQVDAHGKGACPGCGIHIEFEE
jgi:hypothetical protein